MPSKKPQTLLQAADNLNQAYKENNNKPRETNGDLYHKRLNTAHGALLSEIEGDIGSTNFLTAEVVFIIQTPAKTIPISFPIFTGDPIYNYQNLPNVKLKPTLAVKKYTNFLKDAHNKTEEILEEENLELNILTNYVTSPKFFPQKAYHTEKFFFYYLKNGGLESILDLFATKGLSSDPASKDHTPIVSIHSMEIRMHSTRDMCHTCESLSISEKQSLITQLNELLTDRGYSALPKDFKCDLLMSYNQDTRPGKHQNNLVGIISKLFSKPTLFLTILSKGKVKTRQSFNSNQLLNTHNYTYFTSGGSNKTDQKTRQAHIQAAIKTRQKAEVVTNKLALKAATVIQRAFRKHLNRDKLSLLTLTSEACQAELKSNHSYPESLVAKGFSQYVFNSALSLLHNICDIMRAKDLNKTQPKKMLPSQVPIKKPAATVANPIALSTTRATLVQTTQTEPVSESSKNRSRLKKQ